MSLTGKILSELSLLLDHSFFAASPHEEGTGKITKGENGLAWEEGKGYKHRAEVPSCSSSLCYGTKHQFTSDAHLTEKTEAGEQRSQSASAGCRGPARTRGATEELRFFPFALTSSPPGFPTV